MQIFPLVLIIHTNVCNKGFNYIYKINESANFGTGKEPHSLIKARVNTTRNAHSPSCESERKLVLRL